jgi:DNA-binding protein HU-beta
MTPFLRRPWIAPAALLVIALLPLACGPGDEPDPAAGEGAEARTGERGPRAGRAGAGPRTGPTASLAAEVAARTGLSQEEAAASVDALFEAVSEKLAAGERVQVRGFGTFSVVERAAREAQSPTTGERVAIPARKAVRFRPGKDLNAAVGEAPIEVVSDAVANGEPAADDEP